MGMWMSCLAQDILCLKCGQTSKYRHLPQDLGKVFSDFISFWMPEINVMLYNHATQFEI